MYYIYKSLFEILIPQVQVYIHLMFPVVRVRIDNWNSNMSICISQVNDLPLVDTGKKRQTCFVHIHDKTILLNSFPAHLC